MEYSTISVLEYFKDTLANEGLPEDLLNCDSNFVTWIENKYIRHELNRSKKTSESSQIKTTIKSNQIKTPIESNKIENRDLNQIQTYGQQK